MDIQTTYLEKRPGWMAAIQIILLSTEELFVLGLPIVEK